MQQFFLIADIREAEKSEKYCELGVLNIQVRYMDEKCPCFDLIPARREKQVGSCSASLTNEILDSLGIPLLLSILFFLFLYLYCVRSNSLW